MLRLVRGPDWPQSLQNSHIIYTFTPPNDSSIHFNLIQSPWKWEQHASPKRMNKRIYLHVVITQKTFHFSLSSPYNIITKHIFLFVVLVPFPSLSSPSFPKNQLLLRHRARFLVHTDAQRSKSFFLWCHLAQQYLHTVYAECISHAYRTKNSGFFIVTAPAISWKY